MQFENYGMPTNFNHRTLIAEKAIRQSLRLNSTATITINTDVSGIEIPERYNNVGPVQFTADNHGPENGCIINQYGFTVSTMIDGVATQIFVPYEAVMQVVAHRTQEVHVVHPLLCKPIIVGEHPVGRRN